MTDRKRKFSTLAILVAVYLFVRIFVLFTSIDRIHFEEELHRGNIAKELISKPALSLFEYQVTDWEGGSLVNGILTIPFFLLFGETLFSLKLTGLLFSVSTLILWYLFLHTFFHRKVAVLAGLLWILSPPLCTALSLSAEGSHFQSTFFTILALYIFYDIFFERERKYSFILLGIVCGFSLFFGYIFIVTLFTILLLWFIFDKRFIFRKSFILFALSFLAGLSPWVYYNLRYARPGFIIGDKPMFYWFTRNSLFDSLIRLQDLITAGIADSLGFEYFGPFTHQFFSRTYYLIFGTFFCMLLFLNRHSIIRLFLGTIPYRRFIVFPKEISKDVPLITFPIVFSLVFSFSGLTFDMISPSILPSVAGYRFLFPLYPFIFAIIALGSYRVIKAKKHIVVSYFVYGLLFVILSLGLVANSALISKDNLGKRFAYTIYRGYNYFDFGRLLCGKFGDNVSRVLEVTKKVDKRHRRDCYAGTGWGLKASYEYGYKMNAANYISKIGSKIEKEYWPYAYERLGWVVGNVEYGDETKRQIEENLKADYIPYFYHGLGLEAGRRLAYRKEEYFGFVEVIDGRYRPYFYEGTGVMLYRMLLMRPAYFFRLLKEVDPKYKPFIYKGLSKGREYYQYNYEIFNSGIESISYDMQKWKWLMSEIEEIYRPYCYQRLGIEAGWRFIHNIKSYLVFLEKADVRYRPQLYKGLGLGIGWRFAYNIDGCNQLIQEIDQEFWPYLYEGLGIGAAKRYGPQAGEWAGEINKVPLAYKSYFNRGFRTPLALSLSSVAEGS
ncbi:ArnT family glycosyltransferase [Candidatus Omnitrophota bacterium]